MKKRQSVYELSLTAILGAIIIFMSLIPQIGFITVLPGVSITLVHIPVIIGIFLLSLKSSLMLGLFFGIGSLIASYIYGASAFDLAFRYPWVAIIPRVLFAYVAFYVVKGFKRIGDLKLGKYILVGLISAITVFALFFGTRQIIKNVSYNDYNIAVNAYNTGKNDETLTVEQLEALKLDMETKLVQADDIFDSAMKIAIPVIIVISIALIVVYYIFIIKKNKNEAYIPAVFIISTIVHTILVVATVIIFSPKAFVEVFGSNTTILSALYLVAMTNGLIEAVFATIIGTPISIATKQLVREEE